MKWRMLFGKPFPVVVIALLALLPSLAVGDSPRATFLAAAAEVNITPQIGVPLSGPGGPSTGVADELFARILVLSDGDKPVVIVTADLAGVGIPYAEAVGAAIEKKTGIPPGRVMFNCSHTHSGPGAALPEDSAEKSYGRDVLEKVVAATADSVGRLEPAILRAGREAVQIGFNRRMPRGNDITMAPNPHGSVVPWVDVLGVYRKDGTRIAILFSYAAHPVVIHSASTLISADYPGYAVAHLRRMLSGGDAETGLMMFAQGCGGNINAFPLKGGLKACSRTGLVLAQAVTRVSLEEIPPAPIQAASLPVALPLQKPPTVAECERLLAADPDDVRLKELLKIAKEPKDRTMPYPLRAFAVGRQLCILSLPHESFCDYQLWADRDSPYRHTFVFGYTGGVHGYVATARAYRMGLLGGYEASPRRSGLSSQYRTPPEPVAEQIIKAGITEIWRKLAQSSRQ
jgi:neutral ceramidase